MKNSATKNSPHNNKLPLIYFVILIVLMPTFSHSQDYRYINAYMEDFGKNEMFVKKSLMDYSVTIVESQADLRAKVTSGKIVDKLINMNLILRNTNKGFESNTQLRDCFIKMNEKTIECLTNGSLILNDYDYQSSLSLAEIAQNLNWKEKSLISYYQEIKSYEISKRVFGLKYHVHFKNQTGKNVLEYNAYQNMLFYKINVIDQKLMTLIKAKDKKGFAECLTTIEAMHQVAIAKTTEYKDVFKDNSMNEANITYSNFISSQKAQLTSLFNEFVDQYNVLQTLKNSTQPQTHESIMVYNDVVRNYNAKKNSFYSVFDAIQTDKKALYSSWFVTNSAFLKNNSEFENIHESYTYNN